MHKALIDRTNTDDVGINHSAGTVKGNGYEMLSILMMIGFEMFVGRAGSCNDRVLYDPLIA